MTRYTDDFRASAVVMLEAAGYPKQKGALMRVAKELKMPHNTLSQWARSQHNPPPSELRHIKKEDLIELFKAEIYAALGEMMNARPDADYKELATAIGILTDKLQLLTGEATERVNVQYELSDAERSTRIAAILERGRLERTRQLTNGGDTLH